MAELVPEPLGPACRAPLAPAAPGLAVVVGGAPTAAAAGAEATQAATGVDADHQDGMRRGSDGDPGVTGLTAV